jgi:3-dehydroshikimate dehydratase
MAAKARSDGRSRKTTRLRAGTASRCEAVGQPPYVIKPVSALPAILGPVRIEGVAWKRTGDYIAIDGSSYVGGGTRACPGAVEGQFGANGRTTTLPGLILRDTGQVEIRGLEVRNFCIGILINRASGNLIQDNRIVANKGGAGIMLTGDDGQGNPTATTTLHNKVLRNEFIDNGDGLELTRGAAFNLVADNLFRSTDANPEPSQGIEVLRGNDNSVIHNRFENYSDGLQVNWGNRNYIAANTFTGNSVGLSLTGNGNIIDSNIITGNRIGIALRPEPEPTTNRLTANLIWGNGRDIRRCEAGGACIPGQRTGAIIFGVPGLEHAIFVGSRGGGVDSDPSKREKICAAGAPQDSCDPMPNHDQAAPTLVAVSRGRDGLELQGELKGQSSANYRVEVFANRDAGAAEAENYLGQVSVATNEKGQGRFVFLLDERLFASWATLTATVTAPDDATSPLSLPFRLRH